MANIGYGITLAVSDVSPATTPVNTIGEVMNFTPPSPTRDIIDVTSGSSANMTREFIAGLVDPGEATFDLIWDLGDAKDVILRAISTERTPRTYRATFAQYTPSKTITFLAFMTGYERATPLDDKMTATVTLKVTGVPVYA
jgi:hypothetical protein